MSGQVFAFVARNSNLCYANQSVLAKRSHGCTCAAAMDGHTWAAVNGRKYKRVVDFASFGRDSNLCDDFASVGRDSNLCDESASEQRRDGPTCAAAMGNTRRTAVISLYYVVVGMQTSSCEQPRSSCVTSCEQSAAAHCCSKQLRCSAACCGSTVSFLESGSSSCWAQVHGKRESLCARKRDSASVWKKVGRVF